LNPCYGTPSVVVLKCPFKKAIVGSGYGCQKARREVAAVASSVGCCDAAAQAECMQLLDLLRENARFALKYTDPDRPLPHGAVVRLQAGGLLGLRRKLAAKAQGIDTVQDIYALVRDATAVYGGLARIPFGSLLKDIADYPIRRRSR
jgi:hypothetical protein